jgi:multiple sugar transport system substrate-binding protein
MKKSWIALLIVFVAIVAVAAQVAAQAATPELSGTVRVGSWESGDALKPWNNAIASYEAAHPNVKIQLEAVPQDYGTKLLAELASGTAPDVFMSGDGDVSKWVSLGAVENLDPYISGSNGFDPSILFPAVADFGKVNGSTYYLTKDYSPLVVYYNTDLFKKAGVDVPTAQWTEADLLAAAQKLTIDANGNDATSASFDPTTIKQWGIQMPYTWDRAIEPIIYANGGSMIAADGSKFTGAMNSDATISALQWYSDLYLKYHVTPTNADVQAYSGTDLFQSGLVAMYWNGVWPLNGYKAVSGLNFGTINPPSGSAGSANVLCWSGFALYSQSQNKDAAWDFLKYIATGDGAKEFANYAWTPVVSIAQSQGLDKDPLTSAIVADLSNLKPIPDQLTPYWGDCGSKFFGQELTTVLENGVAVKDAMDKAAGEADSCLADKMAAATAATPAS